MSIDHREFPEELLAYPAADSYIWWQTLGTNSFNDVHFDRGPY